MKSRALVVSLAVAVLLVFAIPVQAVKPGENLASAQKVEWNLSGAIMPVPPYGSLDIPGSDTASKLIVNRPNGKTEATITGAMNGLNPNTVYTVYLSNQYEFVPRWSLVGDWKLEFIVIIGSGSQTVHDMTVTLQQSDGSFEGSGHNVAELSHTWDVTGVVTDISVSFRMLYTGVHQGYYVDPIGSIALDGTMSGTWSDSGGNSGTWSSTSGKATPVGSIGSGWPGLFYGQEPFTFTTDAYGAGSWHVNLMNADFPGPGPYSLSVWINEAGGTILISDNFQFIVE